MVQGNNSTGGQVGGACFLHWAAGAWGRSAGLWGPGLPVLLAKVCGGGAELGLVLCP